MKLQVVKVDDIRSDSIQELSIVRNNNEGLFPPLQVLLKPQDSSEVEMVCRLTARFQRLVNLQHVCIRGTHSSKRRVGWM